MLLVYGLHLTCLIHSCGRVLVIQRVERIVKNIFQFIQLLFKCCYFYPNVRVIVVIFQQIIVFIHILSHTESNHSKPQL